MPFCGALQGHPFDGGGHPGAEGADCAGDGVVDVGGTAAASVRPVAFWPERVSSAIGRAVGPKNSRRSVLP